MSARPDVERALVGVLVQGADPRSASVVGRNDFETLRLGRILVAVRETAEAGEPVMIETVARRLSDDADRQELVEMAAEERYAARNSVQVERLARIVHQDARVRREALIGHALWQGEIDGVKAAMELAAIRSTHACAWTESAADLLAEPDPGPTPFLVDHLVVESGITLIIGTWKCGKTWLALDLGISTASGTPALGRFAIREPGPALVVLEESGRDALHRRLDMLARGRRLHGSSLADMHVAANRGVRLDDDQWRRRLVTEAERLSPRMIILDPFARVKGVSVDENSQQEIAGALDFLRDLRDKTGSAIVLVHHTGHQGSHARGSSDLEAYWESRLGVRLGKDGTVGLVAEHREAEATGEIRYRLEFDRLTQTARLAVHGDDDLYGRVAAYMREHPDASANKVDREVRGNRQAILGAHASVKRETPTGQGDVDADSCAGWFRNPENHAEPPASSISASDGSPGPLLGAGNHPGDAGSKSPGTSPAGGDV